MIRQSRANHITIIQQTINSQKLFNNISINNHPKSNQNHLTINNHDHGIIVKST